MEEIKKKKKKEISVFGRFAFTGDFHSVLAKGQKP